MSFDDKKAFINEVSANIKGIEDSALHTLARRMLENETADSTLIDEDMIKEKMKELQGEHEKHIKSLEESETLEHNLHDFYNAINSGEFDGLNPVDFIKKQRSFFE